MNIVATKRGALLAKTGAWMQSIQILGWAITVWNMMRAFEVLGKSHANQPALGDATSGLLYALSAGYAVGILGCVFLTLAITRYHYRARWVFWFLVTYGVLLTPFGIFFLIFCVLKQREFLRSQPVIAA